MLAKTETLEGAKSRRDGLRLAVVVLAILTVALSHWLTPTTHPGLHVIHVLLRKLFVIPVVLAAIWFDLRGAIMAAMLVSAVYVPHVLLQWSGQAGENINQVGELVTIWIAAVLAGAFSRVEKNALREVAATHEGSLVALVAALDAREHQTELHSLRVREYALEIARALGMRRDDLGQLAQAALLHDIGKIGIPDAILLMPGPLTPKQWDVMRKHPEMGRRIAKSVPFLHDVAEIIYRHHERYDGSGYPGGLSGERIPFAARVFAVADVFDALTSDRPYRDPLPHDRARSLIQAEAGSHFDPRVVEAFLRIPMIRWRQIQERLAQRPAAIAS